MEASANPTKANTFVLIIIFLPVVSGLDEPAVNGSASGLCSVMACQTEKPRRVADHRGFLADVQQELHPQSLFDSAR